MNHVSISAKSLRELNCPKSKPPDSCQLKRTLAETVVVLVEAQAQNDRNGKETFKVQYPSLGLPSRKPFLQLAILSVLDLCNDQKTPQYGQQVLNTEDSTLKTQTSQESQEQVNICLLFPMPLCQNRGGNADMQRHHPRRKARLSTAAEYRQQCQQHGPGKEECKNQECILNTRPSASKLGQSMCFTSALSRLT